MFKCELNMVRDIQQCPRTKSRTRFSQSTASDLPEIKKK